jgi:predicted nuclease of predicted toxin-antitoxin system
MLRLLIDQNFNQRILRGLVERIPELDAVTAQGVGLSEAPDSELLSWAAAQGRILLIHDLQTIPSLHRRVLMLENQCPEHS